MRLRDAAPDWLRDPLTFPYLTAWRSGEMKTLAWRNVDLAAGEIRLDPENSKTGKARVAPIHGELAEVIERAARARRLDLPLVFHRDGRPIKSLKAPFDKAAAAAGLAGLTPHDLRRSGIRNYLRSGTQERVAMELLRASDAKRILTVTT